MFKKLLVTLVTVIAGVGLAFAQVDVNKADQAALGGVTGIGPAMSKHILDARSKGGTGTICRNGSSASGRKAPRACPMPA
jgi:DNA uptake protein ComE-like DNA-binding protein